MINGCTNIDRIEELAIISSAFNDDNHKYFRK